MAISGFGWLAFVLLNIGVLVCRSRRSGWVRRPVLCSAGVWLKLPQACCSRCTPGRA